MTRLYCANDPYNALAAYNLALITHFLDASAYFHYCVLVFVSFYADT